MIDSYYDPFFVLESQRGYKVVYAPDGPPQGGEENGNYSILIDVANREEAVAFARRLRKES